MGLPRLIVAAGKPNVIDNKYYPRWNGLPRTVGANVLDTLAYYTVSFPFLNVLKQAGSNTHFTAWYTSVNNGTLDTGEGAYLQRDADDNVTSLVAGNGFSGTQVFNCAQTYIYRVQQAVGAASIYPGGNYTLKVDGPGTFSLSGDVVAGTVSTSSPGISINSRVVTSTQAQGTVATITFNVIPTSLGGIKILVTALPGPGYLKFKSLVQTQYQANYDAGEVFHPLWKAALSGSGYTAIRAAMRWMGGGLNTYNQDYQLTFSANLALSATSGTLTQVKATDYNATPTWPWPTGTYRWVFATGQVANVSCTYGSSAVTWDTPLSAAVNTTAIGAMAVGATQGAWANRTKMSQFSWALVNGLPLEVIGIAANELGIDPWVNIPATTNVTDSTFSTKVAQLFHDGTGADTSGSNVASFAGLSGALKVFVEYSNETWNGTYKSNNLCAMMSVPAGFYAAQGNNSAYAGQEWYGTQVAGICDAFSSVYGASFVARVAIGCLNQCVAGQGATFMALAMNTPDWTSRAYSHGVGFIGFAPYVGTDSLSGADCTTISGLTDPVGEIFSLAYSNKGASGNTYASTTFGWVGDVINTVQALIASFQAQPWGELPVCCYEGGGAFSDSKNVESTVPGWRVNVLDAVQRDSRMALVYYDPLNKLSAHEGYLEDLRNAGVSFVNQLSLFGTFPVSTTVPGGAGWGALESAMQLIDASGNPLPLTQVPSKYAGLVDFASQGAGAGPDPSGIGAFMSDVSAASGSLTTRAGVAPILISTDIAAGSPVNGENGKGAYLTLYIANPGNVANMGTPTGARVFIGTAEVDNYRALVLSKFNSSIRPGMPDIYALYVQIGSAAVKALTAGQSYQIVLTVNGVAANTVDDIGNQFLFTIQPGHFYFVDTVSGNDATGVVDDITHPFRYAQNYVGTGTNGYGTVGVFTTLNAGDTIVMRANSAGCQDQNGYDTRWIRFKNDTNQNGKAPTGAIGTGYIHITTYPGPIGGNAPEDFLMFTPGTATKGGGLHGVQSSWARPNSPAYGQYVTLSNMRFSCAAVNLPVSDCAPVYLQNSSDFWRIHNLEISWPATNTGTPHVMAGAITGNGFHDEVHVIYAHDIAGGGTALENHGYYWDGSNTAMDFLHQSYCTAINCTTGQCLQFHNSGSADQFQSNSVHHIWAENAAKYGLKHDALGTGLRFWDIVINGTQREGFQFDSTGSAATVDLRAENITLFDCQRNPGAYTGVIDNEGGTMAGTCSFSNHIIAFPATRANTSGNFNPGTSITLNGGLYFDFSGHLTSKPAADANGIYANPGFTNSATFPSSDFRLTAGSAALNRAVAATINPSVDFQLQPQPRSGNAKASVGAFA